MKRFEPLQPRRSSSQVLWCYAPSRRSSQTPNALSCSATISAYPDVKSFRSASKLRQDPSFPTTRTRARKSFM